MVDIWLYTYATSEAFAYSNDREHFYLAKDGGAWAWLQDGWLYGYTGGKALGWFQEDTFYGTNGQALYYRRP